MLQESIQHNFCRSVRQSVNQAIAIPGKQIEEEDQFD
jgi:hypothetical protein